MKNKISIYLNMVIICLSLCVIMVGVYSLTSANLTISGSLGYVYHEKSPYTVTATIQNHTQTAGGNMGSVANLKIQDPVDVTTDTTDNLWQKTKITLPDTMSTVYFHGKGYEAEYIEILVTVKNNQDTQKAVVLLFDDIPGLGYTRKVANGAVTTPTNITTNHSEAIVLSKNNQTTIRLTLKQSIKKTNLAITQSALNIQLSVADYVASNFTASQTDTTTTSGIKYTLNSDLKSWSVAKNGASGGNITFEPLIQGLPVNTIAQNGFEDISCTSITIANSVTDVLKSGCTDGDFNSYTVYIPGSVINVGESAFRNLEDLILLSNNIFNFITLGKRAFDSGNSIKGASFTIEIQNNGLTGIPEFCFRSLSATEIIIPTSVISIANCAFNNCELLTDITIPAGVTSIMQDTFASCEALTSITIPSEVTIIHSGAFSGCVGLESITLNEKLETIETLAFRYCSALKNITIPASVTSIGNTAFDSCSNLSTVTFQSTTPPTLGGWQVFSSCSALTAIKVPSSAVQAYKTARYFSDYDDKIQAI